MPVEALPALNKSTEYSWMYSDKGGVLAGLEVFHSMHCLDMVRQYTWRGEYDYSDNPTFQDDDEFVRDVSSSSAHFWRGFVVRVWLIDDGHIACGSLYRGVEN